MSRPNAFRVGASKALEVAQVDAYHEFEPDFQEWWKEYGTGAEVVTDSSTKEEKPSTPLTYESIRDEVTKMAEIAFEKELIARTCNLKSTMDDLTLTKFRLCIEKRYGFYFEEDWNSINTVWDAILHVCKFHGVDTVSAT
jgi:hypothetical protein